MTVILVTEEAEIMRIYLSLKLDCAISSPDPILKTLNTKTDGRVAQVVERLPSKCERWWYSGEHSCLSSKCEALSSNNSTYPLTKTKMFYRNLRNL
jgi:hypothetical protein